MDTVGRLQSCERWCSRSAPDGVVLTIDSKVGFDEEVLSHPRQLEFQVSTTTTRNEEQHQHPRTVTRPRKGSGLTPILFDTRDTIPLQSLALFLSLRQCYTNWRSLPATARDRQ